MMQLQIKPMLKSISLIGKREVCGRTLTCFVFVFLCTYVVLEIISLKIRDLCSHLVSAHIRLGEKTKADNLSVLERDYS